MVSLSTDSAVSGLHRPRCNYQLKACDSLSVATSLTCAVWVCLHEGVFTLDVMNSSESSDCQPEPTRHFRFLVHNTFCRCRYTCACIRVCSPGLDNKLCLYVCSSVSARVCTTKCSCVNTCVDLLVCDCGLLCEHSALSFNTMQAFVLHVFTRSRRPLLGQRHHRLLGYGPPSPAAPTIICVHTCL